MTYVKKRVAFENNKEAKTEAACQEELNNFDKLLLDDLPEDGKINNDEWKSGPGKHHKGAYKTKTHIFKTLDKCINKYYFSVNAHLKGQSQWRKNTIQKQIKITHQ